MLASMDRVLALLRSGESQHACRCLHAVVSHALPSLLGLRCWMTQRLFGMTLSGTWILGGFDLFDVK